MSLRKVVASSNIYGSVDGITFEAFILKKLLNFPDDYITDTIADLLGFTRLIKINRTLNVIESDPDDNIILECVLLSKANYLVTGDKKHLLPLKTYQTISIISASEFKNLISY